MLKMKELAEGQWIQPLQNAVQRSETQWAECAVNLQNGWKM
jgi:hypothetical protein